MGRAMPPRATSMKGYLSFMGDGVGISIPIFVYRKDTELRNADLHLHHAKDGGRIRYQRVCEECGENVSWEDIIKMTEWEDRRITISKEELDEIFDKTGNVINVISPFSLRSFMNLIEQDIIAPKNYYYLYPYRTDTKKLPPKENEVMLNSLLMALKANKQALLVSTSIDQYQRYGIIFPSGDMWTLHYEEELRDRLPRGEETDKQLVSGFKTFLKSRQKEIIESFSFAELEKEFQGLIESKEAYELQEAVGANVVTDVTDLLKELKERVSAKKPPVASKRKK